MSYYYVKYLSLKKEGATITIADSSVRPLTYRKVAYMEGETRETILKTVALHIRNGNHYIATKQCKLLNTINSACIFLEENRLEQILLDEDYASFILSFIDDKVSAIRNLKNQKEKYLSVEYSKKTIIENADRWKYLQNYHKDNVELAKFYVKNCSDGNFFTFPECLLLDHDMALYSVRKHGVNYRQVCQVWGNDEEITLEAFSCPSWPEHLPDLIGDKLINNKEFIKKIIIAEPKLHWERFPKNIREESDVRKWLSIYNVWYQNEQKRQTA